MVGFKEPVLKEVQALFKQYPKKNYVLLPVLHLVMRENQGCIPEGWDQYVADLVDSDVTHVRGVISFYDMFRKEPMGKYHVRVCTCVPCGMCGGGTVLEHLEHQLGISAGQRTPDGMFSIEEVQCLAACDKAPLVQINENLPEKVTTESLDRWMNEVRSRKS